MITTSEKLDQPISCWAGIEEHGPKLGPENQR